MTARPEVVGETVADAVDAADTDDTAELTDEVDAARVVDAAVTDVGAVPAGWAARRDAGAFVGAASCVVTEAAACVDSAVGAGRAFARRDGGTWTAEVAGINSIDGGTWTAEVAGINSIDGAAGPSPSAAAAVPAPSVRRAITSPETNAAAATAALSLRTPDVPVTPRGRRPPIPIGHILADSLR